MAIGTVSVAGADDGAEGKVDYRFAFSLVTTLFFMFGFITCLNDILIPHLKALFTLDYTRAALVQFCFFTAYFIVSLPSSKIVARLGYQRAAVVGLVVTAAGCLIFYPAAEFRSYTIFLVGLFVLASGITLIQVAVNPYISILGPKKHASSRLNLAQAFNSLGTTLAPLFGAAFILSEALKTVSDDPASRAAQAAAVQGPYVGLALALVVLAVVLGIAKLPQITGSQADQSASSAADLPSAWHYRHLVLGAVGIFCYVGAEVAIGSYLVNFLGLSDVLSMPTATAGRYVSYYWGGAMIGRFIASVILRKMKPGKVLSFNALAAAALVLIAMLTQGNVAMLAILAVGFFNSIMFPTIFTLAIDGLGKNTAQGSGILCTAIVGGAVIPLFQGMLADHMGLHHSFWLPIACYIFISYYGVSGHNEPNHA